MLMTKKYILREVVILTAKYHIYLINMIKSVKS